MPLLSIHQRMYGRGVSLVELMVAIAIALVLLAMLTYSFVGTRGAFRAQEEQARKFENGRTALESVVRDLRQASKLGCQRMNGKSEVIPRLVVTAAEPVMATDATLTADGMWNPKDNLKFFVERPGMRSLDPSHFVRSFDEGSGFTPHSGADRTPVSGSGAPDVLRIVKAGEISSHIAAQMANPKSDIHLVNKLPLAEPGGDPQLFVLTDCGKTEIVRARVNASSVAPGGKLDFDNVGFNRLTAASPGLLKAYNTGAYVARFEPVTYFIAQPPTSSQVRTRMLVRYILKNEGSWSERAEVIADGIEDFQVRYGITDGDGRSVVDRYVEAAAVADWDRVISVEVSLVAVSKEDRVGVVTSTAADGTLDSRLRQRFSTVVQLRNRPQE